MSEKDSITVPRPNARVKNLIGHKYGKWTVLAYDSCPNGHAYWLCQCACGTKQPVRADRLKIPRTKGCKKCANTRLATHGYGHTLVYAVWCTMQARCYNEKHASYKYYGAKGVTVCKRWRDSFANFLADMGDRPSPKHSIDRKNSNGNYELSNCRWATPTEQANNTSWNRFLEHNGETKTLAQWAQTVGMDYTLFRRRIVRGWDIERALTEPSKNAPRKILLEYNGECKTIAQWTRDLGTPRNLIGDRIRHGWSVERALTEPSQKTILKS